MIIQNAKINGLIGHLSGQIVTSPDKWCIDDKIKITIACKCGVQATIGLRSLIRRWKSEPEYRCKSCDVKTYANNPNRITRFKESFNKIATTPEYKAKCSDAGKKAWSDPGAYARASKLLKERNTTDSRLIEGRKKALNTFINSSTYKEHLARIRHNQLHNISIPEQIVNSILSELRIEYTHQFELGHYIYDFKVGQLLIEVQGEYWHKDTIAKDSAKATYAANNGYEVLHIWENEFNEESKVRNLILTRLKLIEQEQVNYSFDDVKIKEIDTKEARIFLGRYHYLPAISKSGRHIGAYLEDKLIGVVTFSGVVRKESADRLKVSTSQIRELSRFCIHPTYQKKNFGSWLLSRSIKKYIADINSNIVVFISFADHDQGHTGTIYKAAGWTHDGEVDGHYYYRSADGLRVHKKTVWDRAKKFGISETEYAIKHKYIKVNCGTKSRFVMRIKDAFN